MLILSLIPAELFFPAADEAKQNIHYSSTSKKIEIKFKYWCLYYLTHLYTLVFLLTTLLKATHNIIFSVLTISVAESAYSYIYCFIFVVSLSSSY